MVTGQEQALGEDDAADLAPGSPNGP